MITYVPKIVVSFIVDSTNREQIAKTYPSMYIVDSNGNLVTYDSSFTLVSDGTVIGDNGAILSSSITEFEKQYTKIV